MDDKFSEKWSTNKTAKKYQVKLVEIKDQVLYFKYEDELLNVNLYNEMNNQVFDDQELTIMVNINPSDQSLYYTCDFDNEFIFHQDLKKIYMKQKQLYKLNIEGVFKIKINEIIFNPLRNVYYDNEKQVNKQVVFGGWMIRYSFADQMALDDKLYLSYIPQQKFNINVQKTLLDLKRFQMILMKLFSNQEVENMMLNILNANIELMKSDTKKINDELIIKPTFVYLKAKKFDQNSKNISVWIELDDELKENTFILDLVSNMKESVINQEIKNPTIVSKYDKPKLNENKSEQPTEEVETKYHLNVKPQPKSKNSETKSKWYQNFTKKKNNRNEEEDEEDILNKYINQDDEETNIEEYEEEEY